MFLNFREKVNVTNVNLQILSRKFPVCCQFPFFTADVIEEKEKKLFKLFLFIFKLGV